MNQPFSYGDWFTVPGSSANKEFTSITSPATGEFTSLNGGQAAQGSPAKSAANLGQLYIHYIRQLFLRMIRNAYGGYAVINLNPFMGFRVL